MLEKIWNFCCSLKLAIVLASAATLLTIGGSLLIPFRPAIFGPLDQMPLWQWLTEIGFKSMGQTWWLPVSVILVVLLAINTLCCFIDWAMTFKARWRKTGEYLIHIGFVLIMVGYCIGAFTGERFPSIQLAEGQPVDMPGMSGYQLKLDSFEPVMGPERYPINQINKLSILKDGEVVESGVAKTNTPFLVDDLVIVPKTFAQTAFGFKMWSSVNGTTEWLPGTRLQTTKGELRVLNFYADAQKTSTGAVVPKSSNLSNPAYHLQLIGTDGSIKYDGWYFLRFPPPRELSTGGLRIRPIEPISSYISTISANYDPGYLFALIGTVAMTIGVAFAFVSFYYKRARFDRPDIL